MKLVLVILATFWADGNALAEKTNMAVLGHDHLGSRPWCGQEYANCCNGKVYYPPREMCCYPPGWGMPGQIRYAPSRRSQCCGDSTYDTRTQLCCDGVVRTKSDVSATSCCGTQIYSLATRTCCLDKLYPKAHSQGVLCCADQQYNPARMLCCSGVLYPRARDQACCRQMAYNWQEHICCGRRLFPKLKGHEGCCGNEPCRPH